MAAWKWDGDPCNAAFEYRDQNAPWLVDENDDPILTGDIACRTAEAARLIAAAPDLLEALQGVLRVADRATDEFDAARAAIAKAVSP